MQASWREELAAAHLLMGREHSFAGMAVSGDVFIGGCGVRTASCLLIDGAVVPPCSLFGLQALGGAQVVTSGELTQVNVLGASLTGFLGSSVSHRRRLPPLEKHPSSAVGSAVAPQECQCFALGLGVCNVSALPQNGDSDPTPWSSR